MRIALFHNLPSGGAKRSLFEATKRLATRHHVDVYTLSGSDHDFADVRPFVRGQTVVAFAPLPLLRSPFGRLNQLSRRLDLGRLDRVARAMARRIQAVGYDVVLVHPCQFEQAPSLLRYLHRTPSVYYCHEPRRSVHEAAPQRPYDPDAVRWRRVLNLLDPLPMLYRRRLRERDRANACRADAILVNSRFTAESVSRLYGVAAEVSYHGVDVEQFKPAACGRTDLVLSVGSLTPLKGFDFLIRALACYRGRQRPRLAIASNFQNPPERDYLSRLAADLGVGLELKDRVTEQELVRLYNHARLVVYAPIREPFGLVALEAMACGTPVVAVAEGGVRESVIDGETGVLVERDADAFAAAVQRVMESPSLARRYGENGRAHVLREWTWDRAVASLERHLTRAATTQRGHGDSLIRSLDMSAGVAPLKPGVSRSKAGL